MDDWLAENEKWKQTFSKMQSGQPLTEEERGKVLGASDKWNARQQSQAEAELRKAAAIQDLAGREENLRAVQTSGKVG
jgi:gluconate kinase